MLTGHLKPEEPTVRNLNVCALCLILGEVNSLQLHTTMLSQEFSEGFFPVGEQDETAMRAS